jgi:hypothetical protein
VSEAMQTKNPRKGKESDFERLRQECRVNNQKVNNIIIQTTIT